jgi:Flp pilus assembly protein TadG
MNAFARFPQEEKGTTLVEFALVVPVVILVLVTCLDFARALNAYVTIANASREGARYATVHPDADLSQIQAAVAARVAPLDPTRMTISATYNAGYGPQGWPAGGIPASSPAPALVQVRVDASYDWSATTWLVGSFFGATGSRSFASSSAMEAFR